MKDNHLQTNPVVDDVTFNIFETNAILITFGDNGGLINKCIDLRYYYSFGYWTLRLRAPTTFVRNRINNDPTQLESIYCIHVTQWRNIALC